jgi:hypothetical protein
MKDQLASWRHSAETATIERRSKVIDGRIHDARRAEKRPMKPAQGTDQRKEIAAVIVGRRAKPGGRLSHAGILLTRSALSRRQRGVCHLSTRERT